ncbi:hypothetical protein QJ048_08110 [Pinibacter sp. MAH-24]|uniref:Uncharacterized protein n=2 Tax=Pinibacter soli TaxID=3044211 RepID=A0ABT6RAY6_9BACT|nr:hypothetical protein [Pinibacter soli]
MQPFGNQQNAGKQSFSNNEEVKDRTKDHNVYEITGPNISVLVLWFKLIGIAAGKTFQ